MEQKVLRSFSDGKNTAMLGWSPKPASIPGWNTAGTIQKSLARMEIVGVIIRNPSNIDPVIPELVRFCQKMATVTLRFFFGSLDILLLLAEWAVTAWIIMIALFAAFGVFRWKMSRIHLLQGCVNLGAFAWTPFFIGLFVARIDPLREFNNWFFISWAAILLAEVAWIFMQDAKFRNTSAPVRSE